MIWYKAETMGSKVICPSSHFIQKEWIPWSKAVLHWILSDKHSEPFNSDTSWGTIGITHIHNLYHLNNEFMPLQRWKRYVWCDQYVPSYLLISWINGASEFFPRLVGCSATTVASSIWDLHIFSVLVPRASPFWACCASNEVGEGSIWWSSVGWSLYPLILSMVDVPGNH